MPNVTQYRTQSFFDEERYLWLKQTAAEENKSLAEMLREGVDELREKRARKKRQRYTAAYKELLKLAGSVKEKGGVNDVSENHDKYIGEALYQELVRKRR